MSKGTIEPCLGLLVKGMCSLLINTVDTIFERESLSIKRSYLGYAKHSTC